MHHIRYLHGIERNGEPFTIRDWMRGVREDGNNGWLFISSNADTHASLKPVISMWLSLAIRGLLAMGENRQRRVWFFADEIPTLHKLPDLVEIVPEARKFGGCYVLGFQSYAQLEDIYGAKGAATLFDVLNTRAFFRSPSKQIADFAAGEIGEKEQLKASEQYSYGVDPVRDGTSVGKDMERVTLVSYSDIQTLPDLTCYITLPGPYPAVKLPLKYQTRPKVAPEFIARTIDTDAETHLSAVLAAREEEGRGIAELFTPDAETAEPASTENEPVAETATQTQTTPPVTPLREESAPKPAPKTSPKAAAASTTAASATAAAVVAPVGGVEQELEEHEEALPPGIDSQGELVDPDAYERWQAEHEANGQRTMQRREEVNINHGQSSLDDVEVGDTF